MRFHQVEVDDEVFQFVKAHAEPLVDNFSSALRRLLPLGGTQAQRRPAKARAAAPTHDGVLPDLPNGTPIALRHILEVAHLVCSGAYTRTSATRFVAKLHDVFPQTVLDKYCRQLDLTARQFDRLLEEDLSGLRDLLRSKFPEHGELVDRVLK